MCEGCVQPFREGHSVKMSVSPYILLSAHSRWMNFIHRRAHLTLRLPLRALKTCGLCKSNVVVPLPLSNVNNDAHSAVWCARHRKSEIENFWNSDASRSRIACHERKRAATAVTVRKIQDSDRSAACMHPLICLSHSLVPATSEKPSHVRVQRCFNLFSYSFSLASPSNQLTAACPRPPA